MVIKMVNTYISRSEKKDIDRIMIILGEARLKMGQLGIDQWQYGYPTRDIIKNDIVSGHSYTVREEEGGEIYATFFLKTDGEPTYKEIFEGAWLTDGEYVALHRIAVCNAKRGTGMADKMIEFIGNECIKLGAGSIRVDTHRGNIPMQKLLARSGFQYCGIIYLGTGEERLAYEKVIAK